MIDDVFRALGDYLLAYDPSYQELKDAIQSGRPPRHRLVGENNVRGYILEASMKLALARFSTETGLIHPPRVELVSGNFDFYSHTQKRQVTGRYTIDRWGNLTFYLLDDAIVTEIDAIYMLGETPWMFHVSTKAGSGNKPVQKEFVEKTFGARPLSSKIRLQQNEGEPLGLATSQDPSYCKYIIRTNSGFHQVMEEFLDKYVRKKSTSSVSP